MAQKADFAEKKRVLIDGVELAGLVSVNEITFEKGTIDVPEFKKIRHIQNGVAKVPMLTLKYKVQAGVASQTYLRNWFLNDEIHDITIIRTDAQGVEFARDLCQACECVKFVEPPYNAESPEYASVTVDLLPYEVTPLAAQT